MENGTVVSDAVMSGSYIFQLKTVMELRARLFNRNPDPI